MAKMAGACPVCGCYLGLAAGARFPLHAAPGFMFGTCKASGVCYWRAVRLVLTGEWDRRAGTAMIHVKPAIPGGRR